MPLKQGKKLVIVYENHLISLNAFNKMENNGYKNSVCKSSRWLQKKTSIGAKL